MSRSAWPCSAESGSIQRAFTVWRSQQQRDDSMHMWQCSLSTLSMRGCSLTIWLANRYHDTMLFLYFGSVISSKNARPGTDSNSVDCTSNGHSMRSVLYVAIAVNQYSLTDVKRKASITWSIEHCLRWLGNNWLSDANGVHVNNNKTLSTIFSWQHASKITLNLHGKPTRDHWRSMWVNILIIQNIVASLACGYSSSKVLDRKGGRGNKGRRGPFVLAWGFDIVFPTLKLLCSVLFQSGQSALAI